MIGRLENFEQVCQKINKFITVTDRQLYTNHYDRVLYYVRDRLKEQNQLFRIMFNGFEKGGSYPDDLKVAKPNEFDTVVKLKWPLDASLIKVILFFLIISNSDEIKAWLLNLR